MFRLPIEAPKGKTESSLTTTSYGPGDPGSIPGSGQTKDFKIGSNGFPAWRSRFGLALRTGRRCQYNGTGRVQSFGTTA